MNANIYTSNIKDLKVCYIIHFILYGIIIFLNCILLFEVFWLHSLYYYIYLSISIFGVVYFLSPIIPFVYILLKKLTKKRINKCKIVATIFCVLVIITGLGCTIILMMNAIESTDFCRECPFNMDNSCINNMYDNYVNNNNNQKELKEQCTNRRCIFNNIMDNEYKYEYICNYDPTEEFDTIRNKTNTNETISQIICEKIENANNNKYLFEKEEIPKYLKLCNSYEDFYICQRIYEPKEYNLKINKCPTKDYLRNLVFFCLISVIFNLILGFLPWRVEFTKFKNIIIRLRENNNRALFKSLNSTQNNSKVQKDEIPISFKKEPTEIIIVYNETEQNLVTVKDKSNADKNKDNKPKNNISKIINNSHIKGNISHKNLDKYNIKIKKKIDNEKKSNNDENIKNEDNNTSIKIFRINDSHSPKRRNEIKKHKEKEKDTPKRKKEIKNYKENEKENTLIRSNSHRISYFSERNCFEESKSVQEI